MADIYWDLNPKHKENFLAFHSANPLVLERLVVMLQRLQSRGHTRAGIGMLFEVLRWDYMVTNNPVGGEEFKLNNNYRSFYSRLIKSKHPQLAELLNVRTGSAPPGYVADMWNSSRRGGAFK